jgi:hypothetical protein
MIGFVVVLSLGLAVATLFLENNWYGVICGLVAGGISLGFHRTYRWAFNRGRFDLTRIFHRCLEQRSGRGVTRLVNIEPNETTTHRFF